MSKLRRRCRWPALLTVALAAAVLAALRGGGWLAPMWRLAQAVASEGGPVVHITRPIRLGPGPAIVLESGRLVLASTSGSPSKARGLWGFGADETEGSAELVLTRPRIRVEMEPAPPVAAAVAGMPRGSAAPGRHAQRGPDMAEMTAALGRVIARVAFKSLSIHKGTITVPGSGEKSHVLEAFDAEIAPSAGNAGGATGKGAFTYKGRRVRFTFTLGAGDGGKTPAGHLKRSLILDLAGDLMTAQFEGNLALAGGLRLEGKAVLDVPDLRAAASWLGYPLPGRRGMRGISARGAFSWHAGTLSFTDAEYAMDGNTAVGALILDLTKPRPSLDGTLAFRRLQLTPYFADPAPSRRKEKKEEGKKGTPEVAPAMQSAPLASIVRGSYLGFPLMQRVDADLRVSASAVEIGALKAGKSAISLTLRSGRLLADIAEIELCGGMGEGQIEVDGTAPETGLAVRFRVADAASAPCLTALFANAPLEGRAAISADLTARGNTVPDLVATLNGKVGVSLEKGGRFNLALDRLLAPEDRDALARMGLAGVGEASFEALRATFILRDGSAYSETFRIEAGGRVITGDGTVNLAARQVYMRLDAPLPAKSSPPATPGSERGGEAQAAGITVHGPWARPRLVLPQREAAP